MSYRKTVKHLTSLENRQQALELHRFIWHVHRIFRGKPPTCIMKKLDKLINKIDAMCDDEIPKGNQSKAA